MTPIEYVKKKIEEGLIHPECAIPPHMHGAIRRWIINGVDPGDFLSAVIRNDLKNSVFCADHINQSELVNYVRFFTWYAPMACWGSLDRVKNWKGIENG